jgi:homoserine kinase
MGWSFSTEPVRVRVPATSANLGPGFDALGLALNLYDDVAAEVVDAGCRVDITGEGARRLPRDRQHLVVRAMDAVFDAIGARPAGLVVSCHNRIPQARGLGSSSAAIVAGVCLARALAGEAAARLTQGDLLSLAAELEGHPDNVAPCLLGGLTIAWNDGPSAGARAVRLSPAADVRPTVFVPSGHGLTAAARAALPATVAHADAARTAGRAALLVHALTAEPELLFPATEDWLHQRYRAGSMPRTAELVRALRGAGVAAVVSGAGPAVLALTAVPPDFRAGMDWQIRELGIDVAGATVRAGRLGHAERDPVAAG